MKITKTLKKYADQFLENMGFMRISDHEKFRAACEEFAKDYLDASSGLTVGSVGGFVNGVEMIATPVVIGSFVRLSSVRLSNGLVVAPWVENFQSVECWSSGAQPRKNCRALIRITGGRTLFNGRQSEDKEASK